MKNKIAVEFGIGIIILVALAVGGVFWMQGEKEPVQQMTVGQPASVKQVQKVDQQKTNTADEFANWKSLSDEKMGVSFQIPSNWVGNFSDIIGSDTNRSFDGLRDGVSFDNNIKSGDYSINIGLDSIDSEIGKNFIQIIKDIKGGKAEKSTALELTTLKSGIEALRSISESPYPASESQKANAVIYRFIASGGYYSATVTYNGNGKSDGVGDKIISTMKFTK